MEKLIWDTLHVYGQPFNHLDAYLVGNRAALLKLKTAIDAALEKDSASAEFFVADGEGYNFFILAVDDKPKMESLMLPYIETFENQHSLKILPYDLLGSNKYKELINKSRAEEKI